MAEQGQKILLLDDDPEVLESYQQLLSGLPSKPAIHTATSGARAIAILETEPFHLLISDLNMPKMDGLQVLTIVRRKFPHLRTVVMSAVPDEHFRARAYAMGIDLFLEKPTTSKEITFFLDCIESFLGQKEAAGFRGVQSKSLVDIIQLECLSQSSSTLKILQGSLEGKIWIRQGEIIDAATGETTGPAAFQKILGWKSGSFEILPADPQRQRTIHSSYQGLLLETAQALDEAQAGESPGTTGEVTTAPKGPLQKLAQIKGLEFALVVGADGTVTPWGVENQDKVAAWGQKTFGLFSSLGEQLQAGELQSVEGTGLQRQVAFGKSKGALVAVAFKRSVPPGQVHESFKQILAEWAS